MPWIKSKDKIAEWLYSRNKNDTFAVVYGDSLELTEYATVIEGPYKETKNYFDSDFGEPYDIIVRVELRRDPSADFSDSHSISHNPETGDLYVKKGVGRFETLKSICIEPLKVDYKSEKQLVAECSECGTQTELNIGDNEKLINSKKMKKNQDGDMITPCCFSKNWETKLIDN